MAGTEPAISGPSPVGTELVSKDPLCYSGESLQLVDTVHTHVLDGIQWNSDCINSLLEWPPSAAKISALPVIGARERHGTEANELLDLLGENSAYHKIDNAGSDADAELPKCPAW